jgi:hypothetical protein
MARKPHPADIRDRNVIANAIRFDVALFLGRGCYARASAETLADARNEAARIADEHRNGRRALIYAIDADGRSALVTDEASTPTEEPKMKTYAKKFNAQRAAKAAGLKDDEFEIVKTKDGFAYKAKEEKQPAPRKSEPTSGAKAQPRAAGKRVMIELAARQGKLPEPPDFSAPTHARFRSKLARIVELAKAGDIDGLKAMTINPVSSSPKAMARYRDLCVIALEARQ